MTSTTPQQQRGPLSHIVDALRLDNRQLLLETLSHDPRLGDIYNQHSNNNGGDSAGGFITHQEDIGVGDENNNKTTVEQQLIFGSADLRRVILRQVMNSKKKETKSKKSKKHNVICQIEEEEIIKDLNDELKLLVSSDSIDYVSKIVGDEILSPSGDGSVISPYNNATSTPAAGSNPFGHSTNPFGDDDNNDTSTSTITTYILRGGGFDLPSLSAAALHRRQQLKTSSSAARPPRAPAIRAINCVLVINPCSSLGVNHVNPRA